MQRPFKNAARHAVRAPRSLPHLLMAALLAIVATQAHATFRDEARRMHDRLAGIPAAPEFLDRMETAIANGDPVEAALMATRTPTFYSVTVKNHAAPWTNRDGSAFTALNDYIATVIGMVRDDVPFVEVLSMDIVYVGAEDLPGVPAYAMTSNDHYAALERGDFDLSSEDVLVARTQTAMTDLPPSAVAGVISSRAAAESFFVAGTNRAMLRFTLMSHLCGDLEQFFDSTRPADRIRQDVSRSPGGDSRVFLANCIGCHAGMDPLAQAFAYYDYDVVSERIVYDAGSVQAKYFNNEDTFPFGFRTPDDRWDNLWRSGRNSTAAWSAVLPGGGNGAASLGRELAGSGAFARCHVEQVFEDVCLRPPSNMDDRAQIDTMITNFNSTGQSLRQVFAESAAYCRGE